MPPKRSNKKAKITPAGPPKGSKKAKITLSNPSTTSKPRKRTRAVMPAPPPAARLAEASVARVQTIVAHLALYRSSLHAEGPDAVLQPAVDHLERTLAALRSVLPEPARAGDASDSSGGAPVGGEAVGEGSADEESVDEAAGREAAGREAAGRGGKRSLIIKLNVAVPEVAAPAAGRRESGRGQKRNADEMDSPEESED